MYVFKTLLNQCHFIFQINYLEGKLIVHIDNEKRVQIIANNMLTNVFLQMCLGMHTDRWDSSLAPKKVMDHVQQVVLVKCIDNTIWGHSLLPVDILSRKSAL